MIRDAKHLRELLEHVDADLTPVYGLRFTPEVFERREIGDDERLSFNGQIDLFAGPEVFVELLIDLCTDELMTVCTVDFRRLDRCPYVDSFGLPSAARPLA